MKKVDYNKMTQAELTEKLDDFKKELFALRFQHAINQLDNTARLKAVKKDIARVKTALRALEIQSAEQ